MTTISCSVLMLLGLFNVCIGVAQSGQSSEISITKRVEAAMILDEKHKTHLRGQRRYSHAVEFMQTLFKNNNLTIHVDPVTVEGFAGKYKAKEDADLFQFQAWPGTTTSNCPKPYESPVKREGHQEGMDRGLLITHREIWDKFIRRRYRGPAAKERQKVKEQNDIMVIFEDDVYPLVDNHQLVMLQEIEKMTTDIHWLGWCYYTKKEWSPLCMHAYVVNVRGAKKLLDFTETCGPKPLDLQVQEMHEHKEFNNWSMTPPAEEVWGKNLIYKLPERKHPYIDKHTDIEGINVPDVMAWGGYGGIYTQVGFDPHPIIGKLEGRIVKGAASKSMYLCKDSKLHQFPNAETFAKMGFEFGQEFVVSEWQLKQIPKGEPIKDEN